MKKVFLLITLFSASHVLAVKIVTDEPGWKVSDRNVMGLKTQIDGSLLTATRIPRGISVPLQGYPALFFTLEAENNRSVPCQIYPINDDHTYDIKLVRCLKTGSTFNDIDRNYEWQCEQWNTPEGYKANKMDAGARNATDLLNTAYKDMEQIEELTETK